MCLPPLDFRVAPATLTSPAAMSGRNARQAGRAGGGSPGLHDDEERGGGRSGTPARTPAKRAWPCGQGPKGPDNEKEPPEGGPADGALRGSIPRLKGVCRKPAAPGSGQGEGFPPHAALRSGIGRSLRSGQKKGPCGPSRNILKVLELENKPDVENVFVSVICRACAGNCKRIILIVLIIVIKTK
jgi:hypothetical protein